MQPANKLYVIGIGYKPLDKRAKDILHKAEFILASSRLFDVFQRYEEFETVRERVKIINKVPDTIDFIKKRFSDSAVRTPHSALEPIVLLASGDPLFFGIGRRVREELGEERVEVLPDLSSMQVAFARINVPWDDAFFMSLHGGPDIAKRRKLPYEISDIPHLLQRHGKLGVLTDPENNPVLIANSLKSAIRNPQSAIDMSVCERLGYPDEKITRGTPEEIAHLSFADPNVVIIQDAKSMEHRAEGRPIRKDEGRGTRDEKIMFGLREVEIRHERGLITKDEVRAVTLHKLCLPESGVLWDIGAGSGSVSLEAARLCPGLRIFAIEKELARIETMRANFADFMIRNVAIVHGTAPNALDALPAPDRVFVGGSGGSLSEIVKIVNETMPAGIIVINAVTLETLNDAQAAFDDSGFSVEVAQITVSRSKTIAGKRQLAALNPVFIVKGEKLK